MFNSDNIGCSSKRIGLLVLALSAFVPYASTLTVSSISECPQLAPRATGPTSPRDLRPDDIKVVGALGDSIMAGFALEGVNDGPGGTSILNISSITEFRGQSWGIGGDDGAITLANFVGHYNASLEGPSVGKHLVTLCPGSGCGNTFRNRRVDVLNAALSGGTALTLDDELDYLIPRMKEIPDVNFETDWKMITIQIGSNDQCASCDEDRQNESSPDVYAGYVGAAIERIRNEIPRVLVNLVGTFNVSGVYELTMGQEYCRPFFNNPDALLNRMLCSCFRGTDEDRANMDVLSAQYSARLEGIYQRYKAQESDSFAVAYTPALNLNIGGLPLEALSNMDCFHPGKKAHQWVAKVRTIKERRITLTGYLRSFI
ncbi:hypothetical protein BJV82DRAFT_613796 [Fennellomyces sp. T-0311]|nr:hypothetical protein BJV82DRAFT_613796 [Fennellomyces sp. T-0311]